MAKAVFTPTTDHPYTGIFESGSQNVLIRLSDADLIVPGVSAGNNPSVAFKFLRDGVSSANQFGMVAFETETQFGEWDFFSHNFQSHLPEHEGECGPKSIAQFFGAAFGHIF